MEKNTKNFVTLGSESEAIIGSFPDPRLILWNFQLISPNQADDFVEFLRSSCYQLKTEKITHKNKGNLNKNLIVYVVRSSQLDFLQEDWLDLRMSFNGTIVSWRFQTCYDIGQTKQYNKCY